MLFRLALLLEQSLIILQHDVRMASRSQVRLAFQAILFHQYANLKQLLTLVTHVCCEPQAHFEECMI